MNVAESEPVDHIQSALANGNDVPRNQKKPAGFHLRAFEKLSTANSYAGSL